MYEVHKQVRIWGVRMATLTQFLGTHSVVIEQLNTPILDYKSLHWTKLERFGFYYTVIKPLRIHFKTVTCNPGKNVTGCLILTMSVL